MITFPESILVGKTVPETAFYKDLHTAVMANKEREQIQKNINILEQQMLKEKQPRKRFEMHQRLVKMKAKLNQ